jgi:DNA-binding GntR family transcriptional regulator
LAAERITPAQIDDLQDVLDRAMSLDDIAECGRLNRVFHARLYQFSGRPRLAELIDHLRNSADVFHRLLVENSGTNFSDQTAREHQDILDLIRTGNVQEASAKMQQHLLHNLNWTSEVLADVAGEMSGGPEADGSRRLT